jgi:hypothetical protein
VLNLSIYFSPYFGSTAKNSILPKNKKEIRFCQPKIGLRGRISVFPLAHTASVSTANLEINELSNDTAWRLPFSLEYNDSQK